MSNYEIQKINLENIRVLKIQAHLYLDNLWKRKVLKTKEKKHIARRKAYEWLSNKLNIEAKDCHIRLLNKEQLLQTINICSPYFISLNKIRKKYRGEKIIMNKETK